MPASPPKLNSLSARSPHHGHRMTSMIVVLVRNGSGAVFVDETTGIEAVYGERGIQRVRFVVGDGVGKYPARARGGLKATGTPATIEIQSFDRRFGYDGAGVGADVDNAGPLSVHAHAAQTGEHLHNGLQSVLDALETAALAVASVLINAGADNQVAFIGLADIGMYGIRHDHSIDGRLNRLGYQGLQGMALQRQADAGHIGKHT